MRRIAFVALVCIRMPDGPDDGMRPSEYVRDLKVHGIRAKVLGSPYMYHREIWVEKGKVTAAKKALRPYRLFN